MNKKSNYLFFLLLFLIFQSKSFAQITKINVDAWNNLVCTSGIDSYVYTYEGYSTSKPVVTVTPAEAVDFKFDSQDRVQIFWSNLFPDFAQITVTYTYNQLSADGETMVTKTGSITSDKIRLKKPSVALSGPTSVICTDPSNVSYIVVGTYTNITKWDMPINNNGKWTIASTNTNGGTFLPGVGIAGDLTVTVQNLNCNNATGNATINVSRPPLKPTLKLPSSASLITVASKEPIIFEVNPVPGATSYTWSAVPQNVPVPIATTISQSHPSSTIATISFKYSATYVLTVGYQGGDSRCGNGATQTYTINVVCPAPDNVTPCGVSTLLSLPFSAEGFSSSVFPRFVEDINNDGRADFICFTNLGVYVSCSDKANPSNFSYPALSQTGGGWAVNANWPNQGETPRMLADVNGDTYLDLVGFSKQGIVVSLNDKNGRFKGMNLWSIYGCQNSGWANQDVALRVLADMNGDGRADVVGFYSTYTLVMYSNGVSFSSPQVVANCNFFGSAFFPSNMTTPRYIVDMNNDGRPDIVGFSPAGVFVSEHKADHTFKNPVKWSSNFGIDDGYINLFNNPRALIDMNNDGWRDIVGFGPGLVVVGLNNKNKGFETNAWSEGYTPFVTLSNLNSDYPNYDSTPRLLGDINGDGFPDLIGFKQNHVAISKNLNGTSFSCPDYEYNTNGGGSFTGNSGYTSQTNFPRYLADIDGDQRKEIVGFGFLGVQVTNCNNIIDNSGSSYFKEASEDAATNERTVLTCYPNPASDIINFEVPVIENSYILIYDVMGTQVKIINSEELKSGTFNMSTSSLLNGVYYYQYLNGSQVVVSDKFIIVK